MTGPAIFDFFAGVLLRPDVGEFSANDERRTPEMRTAAQTLFDADEFADPDSGDFQIGIVSGRYIGVDFDNNNGGSWDYHHWVVREGADGEKPYAVTALTDTRPTFSSVSRDLYLDGREFQVNFYTDMPQAFDRLLGGIMSEDWSTVAPHVDLREAGPELVPYLPRLWAPTVARFGRDQAAPIANAADVGVIFPNVGYRQQIPTIANAMLYSALNSDLNTVHKLRIFTEGGNEQVTIPEAEQIRFYNPESGLTYIARRYGADTGYPAAMTGGRVIDRGIASRMLQHANVLLAQAYRTTGSNPDGTMIVARDANGQLVPAQSAEDAQIVAVTRYRNYVGLVDRARRIANRLGYGSTESELYGGEDDE
jgi:hypothetical protein